MSDRTAALQDMAHKLRIHSIAATSAAGSGHPTSCCSMAEITAVLFFDAMRYRVTAPNDFSNDRFVLSKGHAAPILYAAWAEAGLFPVSELTKLRTKDSDLEGHPTPRLNFVDVATGSLGQGLSAGCGWAYAAKHMDKSSARVYVLLGDGESAEGSVWEAASFASHYQLDNLVAIIDCNRLGQSDPTMFQHDTETYRRRLDAFGWHALVVDGHDVPALRSAFAEAVGVKGKPTAIVARTFKGKDIPGIEDKDNWHGKALGDKTVSTIAHLNGLIKGGEPLTPIAPDAPSAPKPAATPIALPPLTYKKGEKIATRQAYGVGLARLGTVDPRVVALDGDTKNSTFAQKFKDAHPDRYVECFIAEQNLVGVAVGLSARGKIPFASTFACFLSRAYDQIRMAGISRSNIKLAGSHAGVSIGEDGPSQMALEDLAMFRAIPECTVFYPSDAVSAERAVELSANTPGVCFIRTSRPVTPVIYDNNETFQVGKSKLARSSSNDRLLLIGAGITLYEAMKAADILAASGVAVRVLDPFTIKPLDAEGVLAATRAVGGKVMTIEDHYHEGGLGEAVASVLVGEPGVTLVRLAVKEIPHSATPEELLSHHGIDAASIVAAAKKLLG